MNSRTLLFLLAGSLVGGSTASAGNVYEVTSKSGDKAVTYEVRFGGGRMFDQFTAFDPESKKFVYLSWERKGTPPAPVTKR